ncbi:MAG TPA: substrate-binding domain-containing protein [Candidatus Limnocylindrales bacterium]
MLRIINRGASTFGVALASIALVAGCSSSATSSPAASESVAPSSSGASAASSSAPASASASSAGSVTIGIALSTLNNPYFVTLNDAAKAEAQAKGATISAADGQNDLAKQTSEVEDFVSKKVSCIIVNPVDSSGIAPAVTEANTAKIPVIAVDRGVTGAPTAGFIASDNVQAGKLATDALLKALHGSGKIAVLTGVPGASATNDRTKGFQQSLASNSGVTVVANQTAQFDRATALSVTENILQAHPDIQGIFAENDEMALGAIQALTAAGKAGKVLVTSIDGTSDGMKAVVAGTLLETIAQQPAFMGKTAVDYCVTLAGGGSVPSGFTAAPLIEVTKANVSQYQG